jgi:hypothetical protein
MIENKEEKNLGMIAEAAWGGCQHPASMKG